MESQASKVVVLTGASSGIGRATARVLAERGARLVLASRSADATEAAARAIREAGGEAEFRRVDVQSEAEVRSLIGFAVERFGALHAIVNNAGLEATGPVEEIDEETYTRVFDTNVKGVLWGMKAAIPALRASRGVIVNISSTAGSRGMPFASLYAASKHAVEGLSKAAALELAPAGIRVNVVAPGPVSTPMLDRFTGGKPELLAARVPLGRTGEPAEIAQAVAWLLSDEASFVNGAILHVDGGITAG